MSYVDFSKKFLALPTFLSQPGGEGQYVHAVLRGKIDFFSFFNGFNKDYFEREYNAAKVSWERRSFRMLVGNIPASEALVYQWENAYPSIFICDTDHPIFWHRMAILPFAGNKGSTANIVSFTVKGYILKNPEFSTVTLDESWDPPDQQKESTESASSVNLN